MTLPNCYRCQSQPCQCQDGMKISTLAPWFGSARMNAAKIGEAIGKQALVGIPFCGGCCEIPHIRARTIVANDLHRHLITLAMTVAEPAAYSEFVLRLENVLVHPDWLSRARQVLEVFRGRTDSAHPNPEWAAAYFTCVWLSRSHAGTKSEFTQPLATRFTASGGSSVKRWRSAVESLPAWHAALKERCEFTCLDWRKWMGKVKDRPGHALYVDPPWWGTGEKYMHEFTEQDHRDLAAAMTALEEAHVVIRHQDCELYRDLYPESLWSWEEIGSRNQGNRLISEVLITRRAGEQGELFG